jgi:transcriptional regulator with XRE-family HTH domain
MSKSSRPALRERFGRRVRELRLRQDLSLEELAERAGLNDKFVQAVETARQAPTVDSVEKLCTGLGVNLRELFIFEDERPVVLRRRALQLVRDAADSDLGRIVRLLEAGLY